MMNREPIILAIETALGAGGLSLLRGAVEIDSCVGERAVSRSEDLLILISELLKNNDLKLKDLDLIAVSTGPGSFTGIRVGLSAAKALAFGLGCPCLGIPVLEAMRLTADCVKGNVFTIIGAGRGQYFWQRFNSTLNYDNCLSEPQVGDLSSFLKEINSGASDNLLIIAESDLKKIFQVDQSATSGVINKTLIYASDNISKYIGISGSGIINQTKFWDGSGKAPDSNYTSPSPLYVRDSGVIKRTQI